MKILFIVESYYPLQSGVPVVTKYLAEGLAKKHDISVVTESKGNLVCYEEHNSVHIHRFDIKYNRRRIPFGDLENYISFVKATAWDVLIFECLQTATSDILISIMRELPGLKVLHSHSFSGLDLKPFSLKTDIKHTVGNTINYFTWKKYYKDFIPNYINEFDVVFSLCKSNSDYNYLQHYYRGDYYILPNAADDMFFLESPKSNLDKYIKIKKSTYCISVANYTVVKNQVGILQEYYSMRHSTEVAMVFIGTKKNDYYNVLLRENEKLSEKYGRRDVYFLTEVDRRDLPGIMHGAYLYLCGSTWEAFSISLIEAMAVGTPFVSVNVGNASELPGGVTISSINDMHDALDDIFENVEKRNILSDKGTKFTRDNCRHDVIVQRLEMILKSKLSDSEN